jgi:hypothetical protein
MIKRKPMEIPPGAALRFLADLRAFHSTDDAIKRDEIAARQLYSLREHLPHDAKLSLSDVKVLFERMRDLNEGQK